jgi:glycosyltransferase involved in cell wall biosynthesis
VQPSGVDFALWEQLVGHREPTAATVLFVGRLASKKGVADAVRAVAGLPDVNLRIVGDGPDRDALQALVEDLGVESRVQLLGQMPRERIAEEFRSATCVVIPSVQAPDGDRDGTPNVLGEAAAARVPVVSSRIAGLEAFVRDRTSGLLHEPGDVEGLRQAIQDIISDPAAAATFAEEAFVALRPVLDMPQVADRYAEWYLSAIRRGLDS